VTICVPKAFAYHSLGTTFVNSTFFMFVRIFRPNTSYPTSLPIQYQNIVSNECESFFVGKELLINKGEIRGLYLKLTCFYIFLYFR